MNNENALVDSEAEILQVGVVVKDVNKTVKFLTALGLGPFNIFETMHPSATVHGCKQYYKVRLAMAHQGAVELELIQYLDGVTVQKEFLDKNGEGMHHLLFQVKDLDATISKFSKHGVSVLQEDRFVGGGGLAYMGSDIIGGVVMELVQYPADYNPDEGLSYQSS